MNSLPAARGSQEAGFTQPRVHLLADPYTYPKRQTIGRISVKPPKASYLLHNNYNTIARGSNLKYQGPLCNAEDELIIFIKSSGHSTNHACLTISLPLHYHNYSTNFLRLLKKMHTWNAADARGGGGSVPTQKVRTRCAL